MTKQQNDYLDNLSDDHVMTPTGAKPATVVVIQLVWGLAIAL